jgi:hypothetical protein
MFSLFKYVIAVTFVISTISVAEASLIGLYQFNDSGNLGLDTSGNGNNATGSGSPTFTPSGFQGGGLSLDGSNYLRSPINVDPGTLPAMTWGAWAKPDMTNSNRSVISSDNGSFDRGINIDIRPGGLWSAFRGTGVTGLGGSPSTSGFTFLAGVYNQGTSSMMFYVDGAFINIATDFGSSHPFFDIGHNPSFGEFFVGTIDNVFVFDEALTAIQIDDIRTNGFPPPPPSAVPVPAAVWLFGTTLIGLVGFGKRRKAA